MDRIIQAGNHSKSIQNAFAWCFTILPTERYCRFIMVIFFTTFLNFQPLEIRPFILEYSPTASKLLPHITVYAHSGQGCCLQIPRIFGFRAKLKNKCYDGWTWSAQFVQYSMLEGPISWILMKYSAKIE